MGIYRNLENGAQLSDDTILYLCCRLTNPQPDNRVYTVFYNSATDSYYDEREYPDLDTGTKAYDDLRHEHGHHYRQDNRVEGVMP